MTISERLAPDGLRRAVLDVCAAAERRAVALDVDGAFPAEDVADFAAAGLLHAPLPPRFGGLSLGLGLATASLTAEILARIGAASLPLGRLYEGHVNAVRLAALYGQPRQLALLQAEADAGRLSGVWNAQAGDGLTLLLGNGGWQLAGRKIYASGAGHIVRPLVTAQRAGDAGPLMLLPRLEFGQRADCSAWQVQGMRATATGTVDFSGLPVDADAIVGSPGDYYRAPHFAGGAWRFLAVQCGGMAALYSHLRAHLVRTGRAEDPHQLARFGQAAAALHTARLWVASAASRAEDPAGDPDRAVATVNLARGAVERAALELLEHAQRCIGLQAFLRPNPLERIARDLATYLRQPFPDGALASAARYLVADAADPLADWSVGPLDPEVLA